MYAKPIYDIYENTKITMVKNHSKSLLEKNKTKIQNLINRDEPSIKGKRHYVTSVEYQKLKYLKAIFQNEIHQ